MKQIWALAMLLVLVAATLTGCVVHDRRRCAWGYHWNGSFCVENRRQRICAPGYHYDGRMCVENMRQRVVGEAASPNL